MTGVDADLATLRGFSGPDLAPGYDAALDRLEAKVATLRKERDAARKQSRESSGMYVQANEQITELLQQESFMERKMAAQREDIERLAARVEAAEAENTRLREQRDAALRIAPAVRQVIEKSLRRDMTQPPVTREELQFALDLLPEPPSFRSSVDGMEALAAAEAERDVAIAAAMEYRREREAAEARCARLQQALDDLDELAQYWLLADTYDGRDMEPRRVAHARAQMVHDRIALAGPDTPADSQEDKT